MTTKSSRASTPQNPLGDAPSSVAPDLKIASAARGSRIERMLSVAQQQISRRELKLAAQALRDAASLEPWRKEPLLMLAGVEALEGRKEEAIELLAAASVIAPDDPTIFEKLGAALVKLNRFAEAAGVFLKQHQLAPDEPGPLHNAGVCLQRSHQTIQAEEALTKVTELFPDWPDGHRTLSTFLREQNRFSEARHHISRAIEIAPGQSRDLIDLGTIHARSGQLPLAVDCFRQGYLLDPRSRAAFDNLLTSALCDSRLRRHEIESLFHQADALYPRGTGALSSLSVKDSEHTRIRIGFVSPDLHRHAVTSFLIPLIKGLPKDRFEVVMFSNSRTTDSITLRIREMVHHWEDITTLNDNAACERVRDLAIDALIDLTGHFQSNRLGIFALRAAPLQLTMIGCMSTTGLAAMDYRITDSGLDPESEPAWGPEKLVRLKCGAVCLEEPDIAPDVGPLPAVRNGFFTFGSFNNLAKVGPEVLDVWADTLKAVQGSRLHVVAEQGSQIVERLGERGIAPSRITVLERMPEPEYLAAHQQIDILIDTFPYNGFTITLLGAFMGVPCLTCRGELPSARTASTVMSRLGLECLVASSPSAIPPLAVDICKDLRTLTSIRSSLRSLMRAVWMDSSAYATQFADWLTDAAHQRASPPGGRPKLGRCEADEITIAARRKSLKIALHQVLQTPSMSPHALEEVLQLAERTGIEEVVQEVLARLSPGSATRPATVIRLLETIRSSDGPQAIGQCIRTGWHLRDPQVADWLCKQLTREPVYQLALRELAARWVDRSDTPPSLLVEQAIMLGDSPTPWSEVTSAFNKAIQSGADPYRVWMAASSAAAARKLISEALEAARRALFHRPGEPEAIAWMGGLLNESGDHESALHCTTIGIRVFSTHGTCHLSHALALEKLFKLEEALECASRAVELAPENPETHKHLAFCEIRLSRADRAVIHLRRAAQLFPKNPIIASNLLYCENYVEQSDAELFKKHQSYQSFLDAQGVKPVRLKFRKSEKICIALISGDFRRHSVSYFVKPWLENIDRNRFEVVMVSTSRESDQFTDQLRRHSDLWLDASSLSDDTLTHTLREKQLDILCDLSGHTSGNRMPVFARRCAPVQITMIGAMQTSGLCEMDYRITDRWMDPEGCTEHLHTEELIRLGSGGWVFSPPSDMPDVNQLPALENGHITFGSFNNTAKITSAVLDGWARILEAVPNSRLLVNGFHFKTIRDGLTKRRIDACRLEFIGRPTGQLYYAQHHRVDIALDTSPFNGLTVSCFAAWMGVPTISHPEVRPASRVGLAIASRLGICDDVIAATREDLAAKAVAITSDLSRLAKIRATLRERMQAGITNACLWVGELSDHLTLLANRR